MGFEFRVALRYIRSGRIQTVLIVSVVTVGILVYTFMASLINGLAQRLTNDVIGNLAHVVLAPPERDPALIRDPGDARVLLAVLRTHERRASIDGWREAARTAARIPGVVTVSPAVQAGGFAQRGEKVKPILLYGVEVGKVSDIVEIGPKLVRGSEDVGPGEALIGVKLADELGLTTGQRVRVSSERGRERLLSVRGVFDVENANLNERLLVVELGTAQNLLDLPGSVTRIDVKVREVFDAPAMGERLASATGLEATDWVSENKRLKDALRAQASTGHLVKFFTVVLIIVAVASQLLLAVMKRRSEIGIMRSMGIGRAAIVHIFLWQGFLIGLMGSTLGAVLGWVFLLLLRTGLQRPDGTAVLAVDPAQGDYVVAVVTATLASTFAAVFPSVSAARVDPVTVIQP